MLSSNYVYVITCASSQLFKSGGSAKVGDLDTFDYIFDVNDLAGMHGSLGKLAEMGGSPGISHALRSDTDNGLYQDECDSYQQGHFARRREQ